jgi:uncharacterized membrane protein YozB (DUF420 family)
MTDLLHRPGFLGTAANFAADTTLVLMLLILALFTLGVWLARQRQYEAHRWVQTTAVLLNAVLVLWMMILPFRDFVLRDSGGPRPNIFYTVTTLHALAGAVAFPFGVFVALRGNGLVPDALKFRDYKRYMRTAYGLYILATLFGVLVYLVWFVVIPNPPAFQ